MSESTRRRLQELIEDLRREDVDVGALDDLDKELFDLDDPVGLWHRLRTGVTEFFARQWRNLKNEVRETQEAYGLLRRRVAGERLNESEMVLLREQVMDMLRMIPAAAIAAGMEATIPVPGTGYLITPRVLSALGLLPSSWRASHVLGTLEREAARLRKEQRAALADKLEALATAITQESEDREALAHRAALHTHWDFDKDGVWDDDEATAYKAAVEATRAKAETHGSVARWYLRYLDEVLGPCKLEELGQATLDHPLMVCWDDGKLGWVGLEDLREPS